MWINKGRDFFVCLFVCLFHRLRWRLVRLARLLPPLELELELMSFELVSLPTNHSSFATTGFLSMTGCAAEQGNIFQ